MTVTINGTTGVAVPLGTASAPGVVNTTSSTTGIYNPTSTTLALATNGTNAVTIDASQNMSVVGAITSSGLVTGATGALYPVVQGTSQNLTSGTAAGFTGIPSWVKRITISISNLTSAATQTSVNIIQLGTGATPTYTTTGYIANGFQGNAAVAISAFTTGFPIGQSNAATYVKSVIITLTLIDSATNTWAFSSIGSGSTGITHIMLGSGYIALAGTLTAVQLTTVNGTDTFATGKINIQYE